MEFVYLGSLITSDYNCKRDIKRRIDKANGVFADFNTIWICKTIGLGIRLTQGTENLCILLSLLCL